MSDIYRITVQKVNQDGSLGELVEILETERESWASLFVFVDDYRAEVAEEEARMDEPDHNDEVLCCPNCERPNQFGEMCHSCEEDTERDRMAEADDAAQHFQDKGEARAHLNGAWG